MNRSAILGICALLLLSACGSTPGQRALSGGAIGAGGGAIIGALAGSPAIGAAIGAGAGAAVGAVTSKSDLNLGP